MMDMPEIIDRIHVQGLFPTPFASMRLAQVRRLGEGLRPGLLALARAAAEGDDRGGAAWRSAGDLDTLLAADADSAALGAAAKALVTVRTAAQGLAGRLVSDRAGQAIASQWHGPAHGWLLRRGYRIESQVSPQAFWTALYVVDDGGSGAEPEWGAQLVLSDPRPAAALQPPALAFAMPGGQSVGDQQRFPLPAGTLALFPAWLGWQVRPYLGDASWLGISLHLSAGL